MATQTPYFGLTKSGGTEAALIGVYNNNMDIIDLEIWQSMVRAAINLAPIYDETEAYVEGDYCTLLETIQQTVTGFHLYKCTTDTTDPAGTFDPNSWSEVDITSEMGHGGGGGGGHIYLDNSGNVMTQRTKAKFEGAYTTDDGTNDITNVAVMRTMKANEYAQLTEAEKQGFIYVDDETTGTDDKFQPVIYSTEEREIGVWTDGKPLYQRTFVFTTANDDNYNYYATDIANPETMIVDFSASFYILSSTVCNPIAPYGRATTGDNEMQVLLNNVNNVLRIDYRAGTQARNKTAVISIKYTKSTDTAGSGQWTPQGVPAVHYSTDEKVIGTWIDGSTIYEKTIIKDSNFVSGANQIAHNISNIGKIISNESTLYYSNGDCVPLPSISTTGNVDAWSAKTRDFGSTYFYLDLGSSMLSYVASASFTLRYTKASS